MIVSISAPLTFMSSCPQVLTFLFFYLKIIEKYLKETSGDYHKPKIVNVWEVDREMEVRSTVSLV